MRLVKLTSAMKTEQPFLIVGDVGSILRLPHPAAQWIVAQGNAVYADGGEEVGPTRSELEVQESQREADSTPDVGTEPPKKPWGNAPKSAWVNHAVAVDPNMTRERAENMTRADLMSRYGERL
jgi:hypothetical protein